MSQLANLLDRKLSMNATVEFSSILCSIEDETDAIDLVKAIDLAQEDVDFTIKLIETLFKSLRIDLSSSEGKEVIKKLKKINKSI
jgi:hypothetical protein